MSGISVVAHNLQAMAANRYLGITGGNKAKSTEKLSSGYKINRAADDAAGLAISEKMRKQIRGLTRGTTNAEDGVSMCQIADGALNEVHDMLHRISELSVQSANGTNSAADRQAIQAEVDQIIGEIDRVSETSKFNEIYLFKPNAPSDEEIMAKLAQGAYANAGNETHYVQYNAGFPAINNDLLLTDANISSIPAENLKGFVNILSNLAIAEEFKEMDFEFKEEPDDKMKRAAYLLKLSHRNMCSIYPVMADPNDINTVSYDPMDPSDQFTYGYGVEGQINVLFCYSSEKMYNSLLKHPKPHSASDVCEERAGNFYTYFGTAYRNGGGGDFYSLSWAKGQQNLAIDILGKSYPVNPKADFGASEFASLAVEYMDKATGLNQGEFYNLYKGLATADTSEARKKIVSDIYRYLYGGENRIWIQAGADVWDGLHVEIGEMNSRVLGIRGMDVSNEAGATDGIERMNDALRKLSAMRSKIGAQQNRLEHTIANQRNIIENTQHSESVIRDTDMAEEMVRFSKESILQQAGQSMLAQANRSTEGVIALLR